MLSLDLGQNSDSSDLTLLCSPSSLILAKNLEVMPASFHFRSFHCYPRICRCIARIADSSLKWTTDTFVINQSSCIHYWTKKRYYLLNVNWNCGHLSCYTEVCKQSLMVLLLQMQYWWMFQTSALIPRQVPPCMTTAWFISYNI